MIETVLHCGWRLCLLAGLVFASGTLSAARTLSAAEWTVFPPQVELSDAFARRQLLVSEGELDLTHRVTYQSANPQIAVVTDRGVISPKGAGETEIVLALDGRQWKVPVKVASFNRDRPVDFANEIAPLLSRFGCNAGGCHGKASGQNGFKLSLFGFDTRFDHQALAQEARGRRLFAASPEQSLFLRKATGQAPHGGGRRIEVGSEAYETVRRWIEQGAPAAVPDAPRVVRLEVFPKERSLREGQTQQLAVVAHLSNGTQQDVTAGSQFAGNFDVVAAVDDFGLIRCNGQTGEATIMARYMGQVAVFRTLVPHGTPLQEIPGFQPRGYIDELVAAKWKKLGITPSSRCDDATFLRRVTIDLCGRLPTADEVRAFETDQRSDKRDHVVDQLLNSPDYPAYFAMRWSTILRNSQLAGSTQASYAFHNWIKDIIARNRPYDEMVRGVIAAAGEWQDAPAINWYWQMRDDQLHQVTADTAQVFLGVRLQCARCHHHPYEKWGQDDYYGLAGFFTRLGRKSFGEPPPYFAAPRVTTGEMDPLTGKSPEPKYLGGDAPKFTAEQDPRHSLVDWMTQPENPFFAKVLVNRLWAHCLGRGLVDQVDDMRETNPPSNPELLEALARDFTEHKYDMRHILRSIVTSQVYQLDSEPTPGNEHDTQNYARFYARRFIAEVFHDAVDQATGSKTKFGGMAGSARAVDLPHEGFGSYFLDTFDRPRRVTGCECERSSNATLAQVLLLANSDEVENKLADGNGRVAVLVKDKKSDEECVREFYLSTLSRQPTPTELQKAVGFIASQTNPQNPDERQRALEDVLWTLLNSKEFMFNH